jgi:hypothetical protein
MRLLDIGRPDEIQRAVFFKSNGAARSRAAPVPCWMAARGIKCHRTANPRPSRFRSWLLLLPERSRDAPKPPHPDATAADNAEETVPIIP